MMKFGDWLNKKLTERNMKPADLTRLSGMDSGVVSNIINNKRQQPSVETCKLISKALVIPLEEVYRAANILPPAPNTDPIVETVQALMRELSTQDKEDILQYARLRHSISKERSHVQSGNKVGSRRTATT